MRCAVFDLDGTLADTSADLLAAANATFAESGIEASLPDTAAAVALLGGRAMLRAGLRDIGIDDEALVTRLYPQLLVIYRRDIDRHTVLYPGALAALAQLDAAGWRLGVCTNKPVGLATELLARLGVGDVFAAVLGADSLPVRKPDPLHLTETVRLAGGNLARTVMIGDSVTDADTARAALVPCVLVDFPPATGSAAGLTAAAILRHFDDLPALLERLVPA